MYLWHFGILTRPQASEQGFLAETWARGAISCGTPAKFGLSTLLSCTEPILAYSERLMRDRIGRIRDGVYHAEDFIDWDGLDDKPVRVNVRITIDGSRAIVDFAGTSPQARGPINAPYAVTAGGVYIGFLTLASDIPANAGCYRPVEIVAPLGSVVNPRPPGAVSAGNTYTAVRIIDTVRRALCQADPEAGSAGNGDHSQLIVGGVDTRTGRTYAFFEYAGGGWGATAIKDGESCALGYVGNCPIIPTEVFEAKYPWRMTKRRLLANSGGAGMHRGGSGTEVEYVLVRGDARLTLASDRVEYTPWGIHGGEDGSPAEFRAIQGSTEHALPSKVSNVIMRAGDAVTLRSPGGGGWGTPGEEESHDE